MKDLKIERIVLGSLIIDRFAISSVADILSPETFNATKHQLIYAAIERLHSDNIPIDLITTMEQLRRDGNLGKVGGALYLTDLSNEVVSSHNVEYHARILLQKKIRRDVIEVSHITLKEAKNETEDSLNLIETASKRLQDVIDGLLKGSIKAGSDVYNEVLTRIKNIRSGEQTSRGVLSGLRELDGMTNGFQDSDLIIVAARPGMGKTAFMLTCAYNAGSVGLVSLEMSRQQLMQRLLAIDTGISYSRINTAELEDYEFEKIQRSELRNREIFIDDAAGSTLTEIRVKCRRMVQLGAKALFIDYLQLIELKDKVYGNEKFEIISRGLKRIAKELNVPVTCLSQLSRDVEKRGGDKRPMLSDLRSSGAIEQDADLVMFVHREKYYQGDGVDLVIIEKFRNGKTGDVLVYFKPETMHWQNLEGQHLDRANELLNIRGMSASEKVDAGVAPW